MIQMTRAGLGICIVPALNFSAGGLPTQGLRLYHTGLEARRIVALFPSQYQSIAPYNAMIGALVAAGAETELPEIEAAPPFLAGAGVPH